MKRRSMWLLPVCAACCIVGVSVSLASAVAETPKDEGRGTRGNSREERRTIRRYNQLVDRLILIMNGDLEESADPLPVFVRSHSNDTLQLHFTKGQNVRGFKRGRALFDDSDGDDDLYDDKTYDDLDDEPDDKRHLDITGIIKDDDDEPNGDARGLRKKKKGEEEEKEKYPEEGTDVKRLKNNMGDSRPKGNRKTRPQQTGGKNNQNKANKKNGDLHQLQKNNSSSEKSALRQRGKGKNKNDSSKKQDSDDQEQQSKHKTGAEQEGPASQKKEKGNGSRNRQEGNGNRKGGSRNKPKRRPGPQRMKQQKEKTAKRRPSKNAFLFGLSNLKRKDDVDIRNRARSKLILSRLAVGPLKLIFNSTIDRNHVLGDVEATIENSEAELRLVERRGKVLLQRVRVTKGTLQGTMIKINSNNLVQDRSGLALKAAEKEAEHLTVEAVRLLRTGQVKGRLNRLARLALQQALKEENK